MIRPIGNQPPLAGLNPRDAEAAPVPEKPKEPGTTMVVAAAPPAEEPLLARRQTSAAYLAHLIATRSGAPQTRERRRADPEEASAAYAAALERIHRFP
jgi:hypothetical protein